MRIAFVSIKIAYLFLSVVSRCSKFPWAKFVHVSRINSKALFFFRVRNLKIESLEPRLLIWQVYVLLSACKKRKGFQYPTTVYRSGKKVKDVSLRHYHFPALPAWIYGVKYIEVGKTVFS